MSATSDLAERVADYMEETAAYEEGWTMRKVIVEAVRLTLEDSRGDGQWRDAMHVHLSEMEAWASGRKSYTNMIPDQQAVAVMDAQEVVKHGEAARTYALLLHGFETATERAARIAPLSEFGRDDASVQGRSLP